VPDDAGVWGELAANQVAQTKPEIERRQPLVAIVLEVGLAIDLHLRLRLQHEAVGQQELVLGLDAVVIATVGADVGRGLDVEPIGG